MKPLPPLDLTDPDLAAQWQLVTTPLGEDWSGRTRYAAAMYFHKAGFLSPEGLEVYRLCSRLDDENPIAILKDRGLDRDWVALLEG